MDVFGTNGDGITHHDDGWHVCLKKVVLSVPVIWGWSHSPSDNKGGTLAAGEFLVLLRPEHPPFTDSRVLGPFPDGLLERVVRCHDLYPALPPLLTTPWISTNLHPPARYQSEDEFAKGKATWLALGWNWYAGLLAATGVEQLDEQDGDRSVVPSLSFLIPTYR